MKTATAQRAIVSLLLAASFLAGTVAAADPPAPADPEMEDLSLYYAAHDLVYSVSKRTEQYLEAPSAVYTISADDIKYSGAKKITDVLRMVPGVDVADINSFYTGVQARGYSFFPKYAREMLVLVDGRTVYTPQINATFWDQLPLFLEDIERIEVVRGPNAALYGANAFNGVINITTKDPAKTTGAFLSATVGSKSSQWETVRFGAKAGALTYRVTAGYHETDGFSNVDDHLRKPMATLRGDYVIDDTSRLSIQAGYAGGQRELSRTVQPDVTSFFVQAQYEKELGRLNKILLRYYHDYRNSEMTFGFPDKLREHDVELQFNRDTDRYNLVLGAGYRQDQVRHGFLSGRDYKEYARRGNHDFHMHTSRNTIIKAYANCTWRLTDTVHLTGAIMVENNGFVGSMFSPKAALVYLPWEGQSFRLSVSRAYRTPSFIEEEADFSIPAAGFSPPYIGQEGDSALKPERMVAYELGYRGRFLDNTLAVNVETFYHTVNNIIIYEQDRPNIYRYRNALTNHVRGVEVSFAWQPRPWWRLTMAYTYQKATQDYIKGLVIAHKYSAGSRFELPWDIVANFQLYFVDDFHFEQEAWVEESTVSDYTRLDLRISKTFFRQKMEVALIGQNLLDPRHYEYPNALSAGRACRAFMVEISYRFGGP